MMKKLLIFCALFSATALQAQEFVWAKKVSSTVGAGQGGNAVAQDAAGNIYVAGFFSGTTDFDPGAGIFTLGLTGVGSQDLFILKLDVSGKLMWVKQIGAPEFDTFLQLKTDALGNVIVAGGYRGLVDFDPGSGVFELPNAGNNRDDIFILKLDETGAFIWAGAVQGPNEDTVSDLFVDPEGFIYFTGGFDGAIDLNPAPGQQPYFLAVTDNDCYVVKLDPDGKLVWGKAFGSLNTDTGFCIAVDALGNVYSAGVFAGNIDINPGTAVNYLFGTFNTVYIQKLDKNGNFVWGSIVDGTGNDGPADLAIDPDGNVYTAGWISGTADLDPGPGQQQVTTLNSSNTFIQKLDPSGTLLWAFMVASERPTNIAINSAGQLYTLGTFSGTVDFDPGPGVFNLTDSGTPPAWIGDYYLQKLNPDGTFVRAFRTPAYLQDIAIDPQGNLAFTGGFVGTIDFDPGPGVKTLSSTVPGQSDIFVLKMAENPFWDFHGTVFRDLNNNFLQDSGEPGLYGVMVEDRQQDRFVSTDSFGRYHFFDDISGDTLALANPRAYWTVTPQTAVPVTPQSASDFAVLIPADAKDLCITMVENPPFRPGFETNVLLQVANVGVVDVDSAQVRLRMVTQPIPDPLEFIDALPLPNFLSNELYTWDVFNLVPGETRDIRITFRTPVNAALGAPVVLSAGVPLDDDYYPNNNGTRLKTLVVGSFDPNDKRVSPERATPSGLDTTVLQYVVRFQNTGTFPADFVIIRDTLPEQLDLGSLQVLTASHAYTWRLYENRLLEVKFNQINLPDSTSNEPESHGFVAFSVKAPKGLPLGAKVLNRAGIYFDYNAPVITNYAVFEVSEFVKTSELLPTNWLEFELNPNPVAANTQVSIDLPEGRTGETTVTLMDAGGTIIRETTIAPQEKQLLWNNLPSGAYFVTARSGTFTGWKLLVVH